MASDKKEKLFTTVSHHKPEGKILNLLPHNNEQNVCLFQADRTIEAVRSVYC